MGVERKNVALGMEARATPMEIAQVSERVQTVSCAQIWVCPFRCLFFCGADIKSAQISIACCLKMN